VPMVAVVVKLTTAPETAAPLPVLKVALTLAGFCGETDVRSALLVGSVKVSTKVGGDAGGASAPAV